MKSWFLGSGIAATAMSYVLSPPPSQKNVIIGGYSDRERKANERDRRPAPPEKKAARKRQKKARAITRGKRR